MVSDEEISSTYAVMRQLRTHLNENEYLEKVKRMRRSGYRLAAATEDGMVRCVAGFRISEVLAYGKLLYVDDLVTAGDTRSAGHGERVLDWSPVWRARRDAGLCSSTPGFRGMRRTGSTFAKK